MGNYHYAVVFTVLNKLIPLEIRLCLKLVDCNRSLGYTLDLFDVFYLEIRHSNVFNKAFFNQLLHFSPSFS